MANIPFDDRDGFIWMDGKMVPWREAKIHMLTHGLHYGTSVFEGERAYEGKIFKSEQHSKRLLNSADIVHIPMDYDCAQIEEAKQQVMSANNLQNAYVRVCAWRGTEMGVDTTGVPTQIGIAAWEWATAYDDKDKQAGISLLTSRYRKPHPDSAPVLSKSAALYTLGTMAKIEAKNAGYTDVLMLDYEGLVAESSAANIFFVKDGTLITPIADRFLNGITRQSVIEIAHELSIPVEERRVKTEEVAHIDEAFVTGTATEIAAVRKIDERELGIGPITQKLQQGFQDLVRAHV